MVFEKVRDIIVEQLNVDADEVVMEASLWFPWNYKVFA